MKENEEVKWSQDFQPVTRRMFMALSKREFWERKRFGERM